jgi:hypothetical protein
MQKNFTNWEVNSMHNRSTSWQIKYLFFLMILCIGLVGSQGSPKVTAQQLNPQLANALYLPVVTAGYPWISPFGIEPNPKLDAYPDLQAHATNLHTSWARLNQRISWRELQPAEGGPINWSLLESFENELRFFKRYSQTPLIVVDDYPHWAVMDVRDDHKPTSCGPIRQDKFSDFAAFMAALINRYKVSEFNVHNWEMGNEPDLDPDLVPVDNLFGCWGDTSDPYYGGEYYGQMLKAVAPAMRAADPGVVIWLGGLLLNDPNTKNPYLGKPELFLKGILEAGAASSFDVVPYHWYPSYWDAQVDYDNASGNLLWDPLGGGTVGKARFLRGILQSYGVDKPLFLNETALGCMTEKTWCNPPAPEFYEAQADHVARSYTRGLSENIKGFIWYTLDGPGWRYTGLLHDRKDTKPVYIAYQQLAIQLHNTVYVGAADFGPSIEAYTFERGGRRIQVIWRISPTGNPVTVSIPQNKWISGVTRDGAPLTPALVGGNYQVPVGFSPVYITRFP